jgi:GTP-binding protein
LIDATVPVSQVEKKLATFLVEEYKSCIMVVNKWDLAKDSAVTGDYAEYLTKMLPSLKYVPLAFTTATKAKNVQSVLDLAAQVFKQAMTWIPTGRLNKAFEVIKAEKTGPSKRTGKGWPKIYYATQIAVNPVTILMFVNKPELFEEKYMRFIKNRLQSILPTEEVPIRLLARSHRDSRQEK